MPEIYPSKSVEQMLAALDEIDDSPKVDSTVEALGRLSSERLSSRFGMAAPSLHARFSGGAVDRNSLAVRVATGALGQLQDVISEIGARLTDKVPMRGPLPGDILRATELRLSPTIGAGSVVFSMSPPEVDSLFDIDAETLLDDSIGRIFALMKSTSETEGIDGASDLAPADLRELGPRVALHVFNFAKILATERISIDLGWSDGRGSRSGATLSSTGARYLESLAKAATTRETEGTLRGRVHKLGDDNLHKFRDKKLGVVTLMSDSELTDELAASFRNNDVQVECSITESINISTGRSRFSYFAKAVNPLD